MFKSYHILVLILMISIVGCHNQTKTEPLYLDATAPVPERVEDLLKRMTLEEKVAQMCQYVGLDHMRQAEKDLSKEDMEKSDAQGFYPNLHSSDVERLVEQGMIGSFLHVVDVKEANYLQSLAQKSRLKIPLLIGIDAIHGTALVNGATVYPTPIGLASTWDTALVKKMSVETAKEMRATGATWTFTPNVDVAREARWGRVGETFGEDPFLVAEMGVAMIEGLQNTTHPDSFNVIACAKHLIAGSESVNGLNGAPTDLSERTIREVFLRPYKAAVDAGVFSVMTAHNELNGIACHADEWMMTDVLRNELGFEGFIVSDWMDIERLATRHFVAENQTEACYQTVKAGMDMHMHGPDFLEPIVELVQQNRLTEERINESLRRLLEAKFRLGLFENPYASETQTDAVLFNEAHQQTALEAAQKSIVLLKNEGRLLPLQKGQYKKVFVTGPNAHNETVLGDWAYQQPEENTITILEGLQQTDESARIDYLNVGNNPNDVTEKQVKEARLRAQKADLAIVVVGENSFRWDWNNKTCGENSARSDIKLGGLQQQLVEAVYASGTPTIVVLVNGRPLATEWIAENVPVVVEAWEPGSFGGKALAQILYGEVNPSAKLPISIPRSVGHQLAIYNHKPSHYFHKYVDAQSGPLFPFGHGLSYSDFIYQNLRLSKETISADESLMLKVEVTNTSDVAGEEVVQVYLNDKYCPVTRPVKELKAFRRIRLEAGETAQVTFTITPDMLQYLDKDFKPVIDEGEFTAMVGGSSADNNLLTIPFFVK
ncbi:glycoside hydrolase family 3 C-terminal domain-containing protein [Carboxylicivirga sediminis]|uniref:beta-glucosidase n=1 Tax=Carboxylicivirga sediminis TaxID=2006564 RepID=A0A941F6X3_9BACT|nr:glycoside hydrolase family 3 N-terminal domain-containing protein [Carboxylicivirga sediminis]MBR8536390.1 glycoside hydrolase family 3 C-terminal domain-containing protein [Carboxylicivirga sediminis]